MEYWKGIIVAQYIDSQFLNRLNAGNLVVAILQPSQKLKLGNFLQLSMDSPGVNWSVLGKLNTKLDYQGHQKTLTFGSCKLYIVHEALESSIQKKIGE